MGHEAAAHDQDALVAKRRQPPSDLEEVLRGQVRHGHLQDRDVGLGVHDQQRHEGAVVQTAFALGDGLAGRHHRPDPRRQLRGPGRVVTDLVVALREAVEVVGEGRRADRSER